MYPSEIRMLDNRFALLFLRGEQPVRDSKFNLLSHPGIRHVRDGGAPAYSYGEDRLSLAGFTVKEGEKEKQSVAEENSYFLFSEEELEEILAEKEVERNQTT